MKSKGNWWGTAILTGLLIGIFESIGRAFGDNFIERIKEYFTNKEEKDERRETSC